MIVIPIYFTYNNNVLYAYGYDYSLVSYTRKTKIKSSFNLCPSVCIPVVLSITFTDLFCSLLLGNTSALLFSIKPYINHTPKVYHLAGMINLWLNLLFLLQRGKRWLEICSAPFQRQLRLLDNLLVTPL